METAIRGAIGGFVNWFLRGGGWKSAFFNNSPPFDIPGEDWWAGAIYAALFVHAIPAEHFALIVATDGHLTLLGTSGWSWWAIRAACGLWAGLLMVAGATPKWGEYIGAMVGNHPDRSRAWGVGMMTLRGGWWGLCLALAAFVPSLWLTLPGATLSAALCLAAGLSMGVIYFAAILIFDRIRHNRVFNHWTTSEMSHGFLLWAPLRFLGM